MGGEPTFVSVDDYQSPEWTVAALGGDKRVRADQLIRRLRARFAPQGLLHYGLGKWYPGEAMPRWAFALTWRRDGKPLWRDAALIAHEDEKRAVTADDAKRFAEAVAARLGIAAARVQPAYEDPIHWMLEEGKLPANVDALDPKLFDPAARARMVQVFARGLGEPAGHVLPLRRQGEAWVSETWETRREKLFLLPGDLPLGSRLPLAALPRVEPADYPIVTQADPFAEAPPLPEPAAAASGRRRHRAHRAHGRAARRQALRVHALSWARWRTTSRCSLPLRPPPRSSRIRCTSKATGRRTIHASTSSR